MLDIPPRGILKSDYIKKIVATVALIVNALFIIGSIASIVSLLLAGIAVYPFLTDIKNRYVVNGFRKKFKRIREYLFCLEYLDNWLRGKGHFVDQCYVMQYKMSTFTKLEKERDKLTNKTIPSINQYTTRNKLTEVYRNEILRYFDSRLDIEHDKILPLYKEIIFHIFVDNIEAFPIGSKKPGYLYHLFDTLKKSNEREAAGLQLLFDDKKKRDRLKKICEDKYGVLFKRDDGGRDWTIGENGRCKPRIRK